VIDPEDLVFAFDGELIAWRGPSPFHFVALPADDAAAIKSIAAAVTYGWGMIPVRARVGDSTFETALWPRDGGYVLPIRDNVRFAQDLQLGDDVAVELRVRAR
jgi:uncharacterized protein DUF1905